MAESHQKCLAFNLITRRKKRNGNLASALCYSGGWGRPRVPPEAVSPSSVVSLLAFSGNIGTSSLPSNGNTQGGSRKASFGTMPSERAGGRG